MTSKKTIVLLSMTAFLLFSMEGYAQASSDPYYRYSNPNYRYDATRTSFPEEEALRLQSTRNNGGYYYDTGSGKASLEDEAFLNRDVNYSENHTTYTGTSIPPGINDGYNATPSGVYKNAGGNYSRVLNESR